MAQLSDFIRWQTLAGEPLEVGGTRVTPQSQALVLRWPNGGFVWNRPLAVVVERDGQTQTIPIPNVLLAVRLGLVALSLALFLVVALRSARDRRYTNG